MFFSCRTSWHSLRPACKKKEFGIKFSFMPGQRSDGMFLLGDIAGWWETWLKGMCPLPSQCRCFWEKKKTCVTSWIPAEQTKMVCGVISCEYLCAFWPTSWCMWTYFFKSCQWCTKEIDLTRKFLSVVFLLRMLNFMSLCWCCAGGRHWCLHFPFLSLFTFRLRSQLFIL